MSEAPKGWVRRKDGILEQQPGFLGHRARHDEAVLGWWKGERRLCCTETVWSRDIRAHYSMCGKTPKYDPDQNGNPTKCGIHSKEAKAKRQAKSDAKIEQWRAEMDAKRLRSELNKEALEIVRQIAEGHNDPRGLCSDWVRRDQDKRD